MLFLCSLKHQLHIEHNGKRDPLCVSLQHTLYSQKVTPNWVYSCQNWGLYIHICRLPTCYSVADLEWRGFFLLELMIPPMGVEKEKSITAIMVVNEPNDQRDICFVSLVPMCQAAYMYNSTYNELLAFVGKGVIILSILVMWFSCFLPPSPFTIMYIITSLALKPNMIGIFR